MEDNHLQCHRNLRISPFVSKVQTNLPYLSYLSYLPYLLMCELLIIAILFLIMIAIIVLFELGHA